MSEVQCYESLYKTKKKPVDLSSNLIMLINITHTLSHLDRQGTETLGPKPLDQTGKMCHLIFLERVMS